eukprot:GFUD01027878.1.p1 GENE.GFUD01027878.1~~GFUD01027878.1.p1  ORF type:complete len:517 (-),score=156.20 GFUD01027878.1:531-2081(-)
MVLIAAAVCSKTGKAIISRQFVELTKSRIEGLVAAFPKLMTAGKQHTFVETDSVRYVYQPLDTLYMLLITTKTSNILEDLETLRLFSRVIPEYCRNMDEADILDNSFNLIFAFDEIVALGYRESVNLAQIRTFVEMDSHEEKVYNAVRETQMREAKNKMREKAKELQRAKLEAGKKKSPSGGGGGGGMGSYGGQGGYTASTPSSESTPAEPPRPAYSPPVKTSNKAMKLGGKTRDVDSFVDQLVQEGEKVATTVAPVKTGQTGLSKPSSAPQIQTEAVHVSLEEKILLTAGRDGGLQTMEVLGLLTLRVQEEKVGRVRLELQNTENKAVQLQTHPNIDKDLFRTKSIIGLKNPAKPFPLNTGVGVLKWRLQTTDESAIPISINCWPSDNGQGGCDVNIEFELENLILELSDVTIAIPLPHGVGTPNISECEGEYTIDTRRQQLLWQHTIIDQNNKSGAMEFSVGGNPDDFFPVTVSFTSSKSYSGIKVLECSEVDGGNPVKYSSNTQFFAEKYEIV